MPYLRTQIKLSGEERGNLGESDLPKATRLAGFGVERFRYSIGGKHVQSSEGQAELVRRIPILSAQQGACTVIFGAIAGAFELLQIPTPGYLPGVDFRSRSGISLSLATMIGGPLVGVIVAFVDSVTGQDGNSRRHTRRPTG